MLCGARILAHSVGATRAELAQVGRPQHADLENRKVTDDVAGRGFVLRARLHSGQQVQHLAVIFVVRVGQVMGVNGQRDGPGLSWIWGFDLELD